jgi:aminotransferase
MPAEASTRFRSERIANFTESVIREMTRLALRHNAVNLAQGFPDFGAPEKIKRAACEAIEADVNQYTITWGARSFREAIARKVRRWYGLEYDPEREVTVCCGSTEGMIASLLAVVNPGDEIVVFEPFYENYRPDALLCGASTRLVALHPPEWRFDPQELRRAFTPRTRAIILNSPHNPTGKVFERAELETIAALCREFDALAITDEIYEHILYDGARHIPIATLPDMRERTLIVNSMSKTYSVTGWRTGWVLGPAAISDGLRKVHDFLTVNSPAPLQQAGIAALSMDDAYYGQLAAQYTERRDLLLNRLEETGFRCFRPRGSYYIMCDIAEFGFPDDVAFARHLVEEIGVSAVPGSSFFESGECGNQLIRFCFCKRHETLAEAGRRLAKLR